MIAVREPIGPNPGVPERRPNLRREWRRAVRHARWERWAAVRAALRIGLLQGVVAGVLAVAGYDLLDLLGALR